MLVTQSDSTEQHGDSVEVWSSRTAPSPFDVLRATLSAVEGSLSREDARRRGGNRASPPTPSRSLPGAPSGTGCSSCLARGAERAVASTGRDHLLFGESRLLHGSLVSPRAPFSQASAGPKIATHVTSSNAVSGCSSAQFFGLPHLVIHRPCEIRVDAVKAVLE